MMTFPDELFWKTILFPVKFVAAGLVIGGVMTIQWVIVFPITAFCSTLWQLRPLNRILQNEQDRYTKYCRSINTSFWLGTGTAGRRENHDYFFLSWYLYALLLWGCKNRSSKLIFFAFIFSFIICSCLQYIVDF